MIVSAALGFASRAISASLIVQLTACRATP
jgi:hypothetical protein